MFGTHSTVAKFARNERGTIAMIFALVIVAVVGMVGLVVDGARAYRTVGRMSSALDAAALAAAKAMNEQGLTGTELTDYARRFFDVNMQGSAKSLTTYSNFKVVADIQRGSVDISVDAKMMNHFGAVLKRDHFSFTRATTAIYNIKDIELAMMLDVTGSMCNPCDKIDDLKIASKDLIDILVDESNPARKVRIALAPYSGSINAGSYAQVVTGDAQNPTEPDCVVERPGVYAFDDKSPVSASSYLMPLPGGYRSWQVCPDSSVTPLSSDKSALLSLVEDLDASGSTAGHLGIAWAWYLISPDWAGVWPVVSRPEPYDDDETVKAVIVMTDGIFNTYYQGSNGDSAFQARQLCAAMRDRGVIVFSVAFQAPSSAESLLKDCRTPETTKTGQTYFDAQNGDELRTAFRSIASALNTLRLSK